jgi:hypothetical protein
MKENFMCKRFQLLTMLIVVTVGGYLTASAARPQSVPVVYLNSQNAFAREFQAAVARKGAPVTFSDDPERADYVATLDWEVNNRSKKWGVLTVLVFGVYVDEAFDRVSLRVVERESGKAIFRYSCSKATEETRNAANCLARHWRDALVRKKSK